MSGLTLGPLTSETPSLKSLLLFSVLVPYQLRKRLICLKVVMRSLPRDRFKVIIFHRYPLLDSKPLVIPGKTVLP